MTISEDFKGNKFQLEFIRAGNKLERAGGTAMNRGYNRIPDKSGWEKIYKPYGVQGSGYYYSRPYKE